MKVAQLVSWALLTSAVAVGQTTVVTDPDETALSGTAVSSSRNTLTVKTGTNLYQLFVFDRYTARPKSIPLGAEVTVVSVSTIERGVRLARTVVLRETPSAVKPAQPAQPSPPAQPPEGAQFIQPTQQPETTQQSPEQPAPSKGTAPVPASVRKLERDIEHQSSRFGLGFRTGIGMNPEVLLVGLQGKMGSVFNQNISFRPNVEFGFGEVTKLFSVNLDAAYRLPLTPHWSTWSVYVGGGPALGFTHQNFDRQSTGINFGDFDFAAGLNLLTGLEFRRGFVVEARATLYASPNPTFRVMFGHTF